MFHFLADISLTNHSTWSGLSGAETETSSNLSCLSLVLLDPPSNVSLDHNGEPGQLQVSWNSPAPRYFEDDMMFMIRYSSKSLGQTIKEVAQRSAWAL